MVISGKIHEILYVGVSILMDLDGQIKLGHLSTYKIESVEFVVKQKI